MTTLLPPPILQSPPPQRDQFGMLAADPVAALPDPHHQPLPAQSVQCLRTTGPVALHVFVVG